MNKKDNRYEDITGAINIEELELESEEMIDSVGGMSTNSTKNTCTCPTGGH